MKYGAGGMMRAACHRWKGGNSMEKLLLLPCLMRFFFCLQLLSLDTGVAGPGGFRRLRQEEVEDARYRKTFLLPRSMGSPLCFRSLFQGRAGACFT